MAIPDKNDFEQAYRGQARWQIGRPQAAIVHVADQVRGTLLDAGCGTGENALFFAARGHRVVGFDFLPAPIELARQKAAQQGLGIEFLVEDALRLSAWTRQFDTVLDSGLFHVFSDEDRRRYVAGLAHVLKPGGRLVVLCFSDREPGEQGPRRVRRAEIEAAFADRWRIESLTPAQYELVSASPDLTFSPGGAHAWLAVIERLPSAEKGES